MAACLLHLRNTSFASLLGDRRDLVGLIIRPDWLKTLSLAAELHDAEKNCKASGRRVASESANETYERNRKICLNVHL